jgi:hypothetical protein
LARTPEKLVAAVRSLIAPGSATLAEMRANIQRLSYPRASFNIAKLVLSYVPSAGATSVWASVPRSQRGRLSRAFSRRRHSALRGARRLTHRAAPSGGVRPRRGLGLPTLNGARALLQRGVLLGAAQSRRAGSDSWR